MKNTVKAPSRKKFVHRPSKRGSRPDWEMTIPVLSTRHIKKETLATLSATNPEAVANYPEGAFIHIGVTKDGEFADVPELLRVAKWFHKNYSKEVWLRVDRDGDTLKGLPTFDW